MRIVIAVALAFTLVGAQTGCEKKSTTGTGPTKPATTTPGTTTSPTSTSTGMTPTSPTSNNPIMGMAEDTFTFEAARSLTLHQGETKTVAVSINRGKNFDQDVALHFTGAPKGVTMDPEHAMIKKSDTKTDVTLKAADDAALGDFQVQITGHPGAGHDANSDMKLTVEKK